MTMAKSDPVCTGANVSVSVGGKVQIVKYEYTADFHYSMSRQYSVPEDWTERDVKDFQQDKIIELRENLEGVAQAEMDELISQRDG
jgi:hypothetical protein